MNRTDNTTILDDNEGAEDSAFPSAVAPRGKASAAPVCCFHCGSRCGSDAWMRDGRAFCCQGCRSVYELLSGGGLGRFYELATTPGIRLEQPAQKHPWAFLDEPSVREKLIDEIGDREAAVTLHLPAIHCVACVWLLENLFRLRQGIGGSRVNFIRREVTIRFDPQQVRLSEIAGLLSSLGYEPALTLGEMDGHKGGGAARLRQRQWLQIGVAGFSFGNIMLLAIPGYLGLDSHSGPWFKPLAGWLSLALALPVLVYSAGDYWRAAWTGLKSRALPLEVPIALGLAVIYARSVFEVVSGSGEGYSDSLTGLIFFLLLGRLFQRKSFDRLVFDRDYKGFFPLAVVRRTEAGDEAVAISGLAVGDRLLIRHGELVPADSRLIEGEGLLDYSFATGESVPVTRRAGEVLYAGGRQRGGAIEVETLRPVSESHLTSLWNHAAFGKDRDTDLDSIANRYSRRFTPAVAVLAVLAGAFWMVVDSSVAVKAFTSVLIVACPCALALAAPLTLGTGQRLLAERGVFLRNPRVIERMSELDTIVMDKTGTLTRTDAGSVTWEGPSLSADEQRWIRSLARHSAHPQAARAAQAVEGTGTDRVESFVETPGGGIKGVVGGRTVQMGSLAWLQSRGVEGCGPLRANDGSAVHVAVEGRHRGCFVFSNALRPEVGPLLGRLQPDFKLVLLSGDNAFESGLFTGLFGREGDLRFNQSPLDKIEFIHGLQDKGRKVMMVGDGLNDAGALRQADVGVAVVEQAGTFSPASDVILEASELPGLAEVLVFSRRARRVLKAGFLISGLYNVLGVSIAAAGLLSPLVCAVLMPVSSVTVVAFAAGVTRWTARHAFGQKEQPRRRAAPGKAAIGFPASGRAVP